MSVGIDRKEAEETVRGDGVSYLDTGIWATQVCSYQNSANAHFHFMKLYIQRGKIMQMLNSY